VFNVSKGKKRSLLFSEEFGKNFKHRPSSGLKSRGTTSKEERGDRAK